MGTFFISINRGGRGRRGGRPKQNRQSGEGRNPVERRTSKWIPVFTGMTTLFLCVLRVLRGSIVIHIPAARLRASRDLLHLRPVVTPRLRPPALQQFCRPVLAADAERECER